MTTREQVVLRLGVPTAQLEGDRIVMYQLNTDAKGRWYLSAPEWDANTGLRTWRPGTSSLVLVFDDGGVLRRHSLVVPGCIIIPTPECMSAASAIRARSLQPAGMRLPTRATCDRSF